MEKRKCEICGAALASCNKKDICFCHQAKDYISTNIRTTLCSSRDNKYFNQTIIDYYGSTGPYDVF